MSERRASARERGGEGEGEGEMVLNCVAAMVVPCRAVLRPVCLASDMNAEQLRTQLDQLHFEAETTRAKANNARLRLLRLSEAAQKLQRQAAISVQTKKENDARELLFQKRKVMQASEKSKSRIELLDELSAKLNEAIAAKETQLIGNIASDLEASNGDASSPVRIVSPKVDRIEDSNEDKDFSPKALHCSDNKILQFSAESQPSLSIDKEPENLQDSASMDIWKEDETFRNMREISSYGEFLEHLDHKLNQIEVELVTFLRVSALILDNEKPNNSKVQQATELLDSIRGIRQRIASIVRTEVEIQ